MYSVPRFARYSEMCCSLIVKKQGGDYDKETLLEIW